MDMGDNQNQSEKSIKEIVDENIITEEQTQEQIFNYINKMVKQEVEKQIKNLKKEDNYKKSETSGRFTNIENEIISKVIEVSDIYIHDINFNNYEINTALDEIIEQKGFKYNKIADRMGINRSTLWNMVKEPNSVSLVNAFKISRLLGLNIEDIFFFKEKD